MQLYSDLSKYKRKETEKKLKLKRDSKANLTCSDGINSETETNKKDLLNSSYDEQMIYFLEQGLEHKDLIENLIQNDDTLPYKRRKNFSEKSTAGNLTSQQSRTSFLLAGKSKLPINFKKINQQRRCSFNSDASSINTQTFKEEDFERYQRRLEKNQFKRIKKDSRKLVEMIENLSKLSYYYSNVVMKVLMKCPVFMKNQEFLIKITLKEYTD
jgi:hypothetical protein